MYESTEKYSVLRALKAIERSEVVLVVIDAEQGIIEQDKRVAGYAHEEGKAIVIVVNKWDTVEKDSKTMKKFTDDVRNEFQFLDYAQIAFVSAKEGLRLKHYSLISIKPVKIIKSVSKVRHLMKLLLMPSQ